MILLVSYNQLMKKIFPYSINPPVRYLIYLCTSLLIFGLFFLTNFLQKQSLSYVEKNNLIFAKVYGETAPGKIYTSGLAPNSYWNHSLNPGQQVLPQAIILNKDGQIIRTKEIENSAFIMNLLPYKNGFVFARGLLNSEGATGKRPEGEPWIITDKDFNEIDSITAIGPENTDGHEFLELKNGNVMIISYAHNSDKDIISCVLQEINPKKELVWEWDGSDYIARDEVYEELLGSNTGDYIHCNSVFEMKNGNLIVSNRNTSNIVQIDKKTKEIVWRLGGRESDFTFIDDPLSGFYAQHHAQILENGNILLYDNGNLHSPHQTRVIEYSLDKNKKEATLVWSYSNPQKISRGTGSVQRLPNGHTFIGWGAGTAENETPLRITELDENNNVVLEVFFLFRQSLYRAYKIDD